MNVFNPDALSSSELSTTLQGAFDLKDQLTRIAQSRPDDGTVSGFEQMLTDSIKRLNESQLEADQGVIDLASGKEANIHNTMLKLEQADITTRMALQVRSKILDAYQEVMRMQV